MIVNLWTNNCFQRYDFKNNVLSLKKQFAVDYQNTIDWSQIVNLQTEEFITQTSYDALNRLITITQPDNTVVSHNYNKGGLLEQVASTGSATVLIQNINYNEKGQRQDVYYGNNTKTRYYYDVKTFRCKSRDKPLKKGTDIRI